MGHVVLGRILIKTQVFSIFISSLLKGTILNDSHSEVLARRAFLRFLYESVQKVLVDSKESQYFFKNEKNKLQIKSNIDFHLLTTRPPCNFDLKFLILCFIGGDSHIYSLDVYFGKSFDFKSTKCLETQAHIRNEQFFDFDCHNFKTTTSLTGAKKILSNDSTFSLICVDRTLRSMDEVILIYSFISFLFSSTLLILFHFNY